MICIHGECLDNQNNCLEVKDVVTYTRLPI